MSQDHVRNKSGKKLSFKQNRISHLQRAISRKSNRSSTDTTRHKFINNEYKITRQYSKYRWLYSRRNRNNSRSHCSVQNHKTHIKICLRSYQCPQSHLSQGKLTKKRQQTRPRTRKRNSKRYERKDWSYVASIS